MKINAYWSTINCEFYLICLNESVSCIRQLQREITNQIDITSWNHIFVFQCCIKLPKLTLSFWQQFLGSKTEIRKLTDLIKFLTKSFQSLESITDIIGSKTPNSSQNTRNVNNPDKSGSLKYIIDLARNSLIWSSRDGQPQ